MAEEEHVISLQYALNPTKDQIGQLKSHAGAVRFAYNYGLGKIKENWEQVKTGEATEYINVSAFSMRKLFNEEKAEIAPWWAENSKEAYATGFTNLNNAMEGFFAKRTGFPKFKTKGFDDGSGIIFTTGVRRLEEDRRHFTMPVIGKIRLRERATKLAYLLRKGGRITNVSVKFVRTRWFLTATVRVDEDLYWQYHLLRTKKDKKRVVGVDLGISNLAVFSDGTVIENPKQYEKALRKLRTQQKELSRRRKFNKKTGEVPSNRYLRTRTKLRKTYARVANQERDFAHKLSKFLVDNYETIGLEDLNVAGMVKNRHLSRRITHASFSRIRSFVEYKSDFYGSEVVIIDRFYPSSKTCSGCGAVKAKLSLSERVFDCLKCGLKIDRDLNAAKNIENIAAQSCGEALNGRGEKSSGLTKDETIFSETSSGVMPQPDLGVLDSLI